MSTSTLSEIIEEEARRSLYESFGVNDDLMDLVRISQEIAIRSAARIDSTMILIHRVIDRDQVLASVKELVNDRLRNQWLRVDATLHAVVDHVVDKIEGGAGIRSVDTKTDLATDDTIAPSEIPRTVLDAGPSCDHKSISIATDAIASIGNALGILNEPTPWIENMKIAILSRIGVMRKSVSRIEEIRKAELASEGGLTPIPVEDIRRMVRDCIVDVAAEGPPLHATTFGALSGAAADRVAKKYVGCIWRTAPSVSQAVDARLAPPSHSEPGFALYFGDNDGFVHRLSRNQALREIEVTRMRSGRQSASSLVVLHDGPATCATCADSDLPDVYALGAVNAKLWHEINLINSPQTTNFMEAVRVVAGHLVRYWGSERDASKRPEDWITLIVDLLGKASKAHFDGDRDKLLHHVITLAAICLNWHRNMMEMRPGIGPANDKEQKRSADNLRSVDALITREGLDR